MPSLGCKNSPETIEKLRLAHIGKVISHETREKLRKANLGKKHSLETRLKMSLSAKGKVYKPETIEKIRLSKIGIPIPAHVREASRLKKLGSKTPLSTRLKMSATHIRIREKKANWKGGITPINTAIRESMQYRLWRESIFKRDNYTCLQCGQRGGKINADHIKRFSEYPELRFSLENGRTLCVPCHRKTDTYSNRGLKRVAKCT